MTEPGTFGQGQQLAKTALVSAAIVLVAQAATARTDLSLSDFIVETTASFESWIDNRDLLVMRHPWVSSSTGGYASASVVREIPSNLKPPLRLSLYVSDDYFNDFWRAKNDCWLGGDGFYAHRFKEVWVNGELLWESDVADANPPDRSGTVVLDLPRVQPDSEIKVELKLVDRVSSLVELASDTQHISTTETHAEKPGDPARFMTHVYWGDIAILSTDENPPVSLLPHSRLVEELHHERCPVLPCSDSEVSFPLEFKLQTAAPLPNCGVPVRCGIPLPQGLLGSATMATLCNPSDDVISADLRAISRWEDGSVRWLSAAFTAGPGHENKVFHVERNQLPSPRFETADRFQIPSFGLAKPGEIDGKGKLFAVEDFYGNRSVSEDPKTWCAEILLKDGTVFPAFVANATLAADSPLFPRLEISGIHRSTKEVSAVCRFDHQTATGGGIPILLSEHRLYFDKALPSPLEELRLTTDIPFSRELRVFLPCGHILTAQEISNSTDEHTFTLDDRGGVWLNKSEINRAGMNCLWLAVQGTSETHLLVLRHAIETGQTGFRIRRSGERVVIQCLPFTDVHSERGYPFTPGEAKTFQLLYALLPAEATQEEFSRIAANFERPPILTNPGLFCQSGAFGLASTAQGHSEVLHEFLQKYYPHPLRDLQWGKSPRDFGDTIYSASNSWRNGYYDLRQGFVAAYLLTGNRDWADALERAVQHHVDVDVIHSSTGHPDWIGLPHGYGENHTSMDPWNPIVRLNGILAAAQIWGNERFHDAAMKMAKVIVDTGRGMGSSSVRNHAGIMMSLASAYRETRDRTIKEAADRLVKDILENRLEPRRGTYPEVHGNWNYRGNVPWMVVQLIEPLYLFYGESGNLDAARMVVGMAESILSENQVRGVPGDIFGYSHNPHFSKTSGYHVLIVPCLFYAYELTGKGSFLDAAWAAWEQTVREATFNDVQNCFWNTPTLSHYLRTTRPPHRQ